MKKLITATAWSVLSLLLIQSVFSAPLSTDQAPEQPIVRSFGDAKHWVTNEDLVWVIGKTNEKIVVPKGFVTDYASIPPAIGLLVGLTKNGKYDRAAVIHDFLYWSQGCTRAQSDRLLVIAMKESAVAGLDSFKIFQGVDKGGKLAWEQNERERAAGKPKVIPKKYLRPADPNMNWPEYRDLLIENGVKDPAFPKNPSYCKYGDSTEVPTQAIQ